MPCKRFNSACDIDGLMGNALLLIISGETSGISQFCKFKLSKWVMYRGKRALFPRNLLLGRFPGSTIDDGSIIMTTILIAKSQVLLVNLLHADSR